MSRNPSSDFSWLQHLIAIDPASSHRAARGPAPLIAELERLRPPWASCIRCPSRSSLRPSISRLAALSSTIRITPVLPALYGASMRTAAGPSVDILMSAGSSVRCPACSAVPLEPSARVLSLALSPAPHSFELELLPTVVLKERSGAANYGRGAGSMTGSACASWLMTVSRR